MKLGFIGTGALASSIVIGIRSVANDPVPIVVSPRNEKLAAELAARFPDVQVAADNQGVLDACDTVMLAVRPQIAREVLSALTFRPSHHLISLIATVSPDEIATLTAPASRVTKAVPMPMAAYGLGPTIIFPPDPVAAALFNSVGKAIEVESASELDALSVATSTFATFFKYLETIETWLQDHGVGEARAHDYLATLYEALGSAPVKTPDVSFMKMANEEYATRGGLNEQVLRELMSKDIFAAITESLDNVHRRIVGG